MPRPFDPRPIPTDALKELSIELGQQVQDLVDAFDINFEKWGRAPDADWANYEKGIRIIRLNRTRALNKLYKVKQELIRRDIEDFKATERQRLNPRV